MQFTKIYLIALSLVLFQPAVADVSEGSVPSVVPPALDMSSQSAGLISTDILSQVATNCRNEIIQLHQQKSMIPQDKQREYSITLGIAAEKCDALTHAFQELQKASADHQAYQQNLQHAQSCAQGGEGYSFASPEPVYAQPQPAPELSPVAPGPLVDPMMSNSPSTGTEFTPYQPAAPVQAEPLAPITAEPVPLR